MRFPSRCASLISPILVLAAATGCSSWSTIDKESPVAYIERAKPSRVRLSLAESTIVLSRPSISGDSILGRPSDSKAREQVAVPASGIRKLEGPSSGPGLLAFVLVTGAATVLYFLSHFRAIY